MDIYDLFSSIDIKKPIENKTKSYGIWLSIKNVYDSTVNHTILRAIIMLTNTNPEEWVIGFVFLAIEPLSDEKWKYEKEQ